MPPATPLLSYTPDDAGVTVAALEFLRTNEGKVLLSRLKSLPDPASPTVSEIAALRKTHAAPMLHAALVLTGLQEKGRRKFPNLPFVWATPEALEQGTSRLVAEHKARRFAQENPSAIFDLCAGIGGDALALADAAPVTAIDLSPVRSACLRFNALDQQPPPRFELIIQIADVAAALHSIPPGSFIHIDPARRSRTARGTKRSPHFQDSIPGPDLIEKLFARVEQTAAGGGAIKLSPATDFSELPVGHLELISESGSVAQALLWRGKLAHDPATRTATMIAPGRPPFSFTAAPALPGLPPIPAFRSLLQPAPALPETPITLYELDGTLSRANLAAPFAATAALLPLTSDAGYCISHAPPLSHPALTPFILRAAVPFSEDRVIAMLRRLPPSPPGPVEVKSRGHLPDIDTDHLQRTWSKTAPGLRTVLLFSYEGDIIAAAADRPAIPPRR